ncbi:MAG: uracil-DNA glycosylase [Pseudomonadota bacterium]
MAAGQSALDAVLAFYADCGVTAHLRETPQNRFAPPAKPAPVAAAPKNELAPSSDPDSGAAGGMVADARAAAAAAPTLEALKSALVAFEGCPLKQTAKRTCPGEGPSGAPVMFVGEAPGRDEDEQGRPFVGRSGQLLDKMISAIGLSREAVYVTNVIPWRPPGNRTPSPMETATCEVFVRREIALVRPRVLVALGGPAAKSLLAITTGIMRARGRWMRYEDVDADPIDAIATFHPAYLLRNPIEKRRAWQDLLAIKGRLESGNDPLPS